MDRRAPIRTRILVDLPDGENLMETIDLGLGGAYCRSRVPFPMGSTLSCKICLSGGGKTDSVQVTALVLRSRYQKDGYRIGLRFTKMGKEARQALKKFLETSVGRRDEDSKGRGPR